MINSGREIISINNTSSLFYRDLNTETLGKIKEITSKIAQALYVSGPFNMQLIAKDNELKVCDYIQNLQ